MATEFGIKAGHVTALSETSDGVVVIGACQNTRPGADSIYSLDRLTVSGQQLPVLRVSGLPSADLATRPMIGTVSGDAHTSRVSTAPTATSLGKSHVKHKKVEINGRYV